MSFDEFFKKVDEEITSTKKDEAAASQAIIERKAFLSDVVDRIRPIAEKYQEELINRDIEVDVSSSKGGILFSMKKKNTNYTHALSMSESDKYDGFFTFVCHSTDDDGRKFTSTNGAIYSQSNWKDEEFVEKLEKHISDYLFYSKRH